MKIEKGKSPEGQHGRLKVIRELKLNISPSVSIGSSVTRFSEINVDISRGCRPDVVADAAHLPFVSGTISEVIFTDVIEHLNRGSEQKTLGEIRRIMTKGGRLLVSTPNNRRIFAIFDPSYWLAGHRHYSPREIANIMEKAEFRLELIFTSGGVCAMLGVIWYSFITWPFKKIFRNELPYSPEFLRKREDAEYLGSTPSHGYTVFALGTKT